MSLPPQYDSPPRFSTPGGEKNKTDADGFETEAFEMAASPAKTGGDADIPGWAQGMSFRKSAGADNRLAAIVAQLPSNNPENYLMAEAALEIGSPIMAAAMSDYAESDGRALSRATTGGARSFARAHTLRGHTMRRQSTRQGRRSIFGIDDEELEEIQQSFTVIQNVRKQPARMTVKRQIVREELENIQATQKRLGRLQLWWAETSQAWVNGWRNFKERIKHAGLWKKHMKHLEGKHGAAVGTYFRFLRWTLFVNIFMAVLFCFFIMVPYAIEHGRGESHTDEWQPVPNDDFSAAEEIIGLFTGGASLNRTSYFIGSYWLSYEKNAPPAITSYDVALAYFLVTGCYLLVSFLLVVGSVAEAVKQTVNTPDGQNDYSEVVFASYDHTLNNSNSVKIKRLSIVQLLRELMGEAKSREEYAKMDRRVLLGRRVLVNFIIFTTLGLALWSVNVTVTKFANSNDTIEALIPALLLALYNNMLPFAFEMLAAFECWRTVLFVIQVSVVRAIILRLVGLYVFFYTVFINRVKFMCWETYVGQQVYNVFVITVIFEVTASIFMSPLQKWTHENVECMRAFVAESRFATIKNTLALVYSQALVWFGAFFCPMLPVLAVAKTVVLFYLKKGSTLRFCSPPKTSFKATHSLRGLIYSVLLVTLLCVAVPLGYAIVA
eukprot:m.308923 g.308923  ORF g.308923 m.308923 type:complete len:665 (-) comp19634_c2_seq19:4901-6895(-)